MSLLFHTVKDNMKESHSEWDIHSTGSNMNDVNFEIHPKWDEHGERTICDIIGKTTADLMNAQKISKLPEMFEVLKVIVRMDGKLDAEDVKYIHRLLIEAQTLETHLMTSCIDYEVKK